MSNLISKYNYILNNIDKNNKPNLFLHVCCCPCSSHIIQKLIDYFNIYIVFYNPNIDTKEEFDKRLNELIRFIDIVKKEQKIDNISIIYKEYNHNEFLDYVVGFENCKEGGERCEKCIKLRLEKSFEIVRNYIEKNNINNVYIRNNGIFSYFCTSLSTSPHKNATLIYDLGEKICKNSDILYLPSDFKKEDGFLNSIKLTKKYNIYRQNYCGCEFSKNK